MRFKAYSFIFLFFLLVTLVSGAQPVNRMPSKTILDHGLTFTPYDVQEGFAIKVTGIEERIYGREGVRYNPRTDTLTLTPKNTNLFEIKECDYDRNHIPTCTRRTVNPRRYLPELRSIRDRQTLYKSRDDLQGQRVQTITNIEQRCRGRGCKIGNNSIVVTPEGDYNSVNTNVKDETGFAHSTVVDSSLVSYYNFNIRQTSSVYDYTDNNNTGTLDSTSGRTPRWAGYEGDSGGSYYFDGANDNIYFPVTNPMNFDGSSDEFTIAFKVFYDNDYTTQGSLGGNKESGAIGSGAAGWQISYRLDRTILTLEDQAGNWCGYTGIDDYPAQNREQWYDMVFTHDGTTLSVYVNGTLEDTAPCSNVNMSDIESTAITTFGMLPDTGYDFQGYLDEVYVFDEAKNSTYISNLYSHNADMFEATGSQVFEDVNFSTESYIVAVDLEDASLSGGSLKVELNGSNYTVNNNKAYIKNFFSGLHNMTLWYESDGFQPAVVNGNITITPSNASNNLFLGELFNISNQIDHAHISTKDEDLITYFPFATEESMAEDYTPYKNDGTIEGNAQYNTSGYFNGALSVDASGPEYVGFPQITLNEVTITWCQETRTWDGVWSMLWGEEGSTSNFFGYYNPGNYFRLRSTTGSSSADWTINMDSRLDQWECFVVLYDSYNDRAELYINGTSQGNRTLLGDPLTISSFGYGYSTASYQVDANFDEVMIYKRLLTPTEIDDIWLNQSERYYGTGEKHYNNVDLSNIQSVNLTLNSCELESGDYIQASINGGAYENFSSCFIQDYTVPSPSSASEIIIKYFSGSSGFFTPLDIFNMTLALTPQTLPTINVISPANTTYGSASIPLDVIGTNVDNWFYSLNGGTNTSFSPNTTITANLGGNNIIVYGNNSYGFDSEQVYFTHKMIPPMLNGTHYFAYNYLWDTREVTP